MNKLIKSLILLMILLLGCSSSKIIKQTTYSLIKFSNEKFAPKDTSEILVFNNRLEIRVKYFEYGIVKVDGESSELNQIKKICAQEGANAIVIDPQNYVLIIFLESIKKENITDGKSI